MHFFDQLSDLFKAKYPILMLRTYEFDRAYDHLKRFARNEDYLLYRWNCAEGLGEMGLTFDTVLPVGDRIFDPVQVLAEIDRRLDSRDQELFVLEGLSDYYHDPSVKVLLRTLALDLLKAEVPKHIVLIQPAGQVPAELLRFISVIDMPLPYEEELMEILNTQVKAFEAELQPAMAKELVKAALGLTAREAALAFRLAGVRDAFGHRALEAVRDAVALVAKEGN